MRETGREGSTHCLSPDPAPHGRNPLWARALPGNPTRRGSRRPRTILDTCDQVPTKGMAPRRSRPAAGPAHHAPPITPRPIRAPPPSGPVGRPRRHFSSMWCWWWLWLLPLTAEVRRFAAREPRGRPPAKPEETPDPHVPAPAGPRRRPPGRAGTGRPRGRGQRSRALAAPGAGFPAGTGDGGRGDGRAASWGRLRSRPGSRRPGPPPRGVAGAGLGRRGVRAPARGAGGGPAGAGLRGGGFDSVRTALYSPNSAARS